MDSNIQTTDIFINKPAEQICRLLSFTEEDNLWLQDLSSADWAEIVANADGFGLAPLIFIQLKKLDFLNSIDASINELLQNSYRYSVAKGLQRKHELLILIENLGQLEIPTILLKGSHLAEEIYCDQATRPMADLDLLVPEEALESASRELRNLGYQPNKEFSTEYEASVSHQLPFFFKPDHYPIEIHWNIITPKLPFNIDVNGLWERKRAFIIAGKPVFILSREDTILHLAIHAASQHKLTGSLRLIYDFAALIHTYGDDINWAVLLDRSSAWGASSALYLIHILAQSLFGVDAPSEFLESLKPDNYDESWEINARELLFINTKLHPGFSRNLAAFLSAEDLSGKVRLGFHRLFPARSEIARILPVNLRSTYSLLLYPRYVLYLIKRHYRSLIKIAGGEKNTSEHVKLAVLLQQREDFLDRVLMK